MYEKKNEAKKAQVTADFSRIAGVDSFIHIKLFYLKEQKYVQDAEQKLLDITRQLEQELPETVSRYFIKITSNVASAVNNSIIVFNFSTKEGLITLASEYYKHKLQNLEIAINVSRMPSITLTLP